MNPFRSTHSNPRRNLCKGIWRASRKACAIALSVVIWMAIRLIVFPSADELTIAYLAESLAHSGILRVAGETFTHCKKLVGDQMKSISTDNSRRP